MNKKINIVVIGVGYVGLPLALEFGKKYITTGYDNSDEKIKCYKNYFDPSGEVSYEEIKAAKFLKFSNNPRVIKNANFIIVAVPTPVNSKKIPDLSSLENVSKTIGKNLKKGSVVIYEPTVYPGATEEVCIPIIEKHSGLKWKKDFNVGYSPERINPGDKERSITNIVKIVSADNEKTLNLIGDLYRSIIPAGIYRASSIKVAEAAKVIENTQRDLNIALINELAIIFNKIGIDTKQVLEASATKWNFIPFKPGLVGGHCIGVDPYYITYKAQKLGYNPQVILAGRKINDSMPLYLTKQIISKIKKKGIKVLGSRIIVLGLTFKENCSDLRNSKVIDLVKNLKNYGCNVFAHDPIAISDDAEKNYNIILTKWNDLKKADVIVAAVPHKFYFDISIEKILNKLNSGGIFIDIKSAYPENKILSNGNHLWRL